MARFNSSAMAMRAFVVNVYVYGDFGAKNGFFKAYLYTGFHIASATLLPWPAATAAAKEVFKDIAQTQIAKVKINILPTGSKRIATAKRITSGSATNPGMAELVVTLTLGRVFEHFVGFVDFFKLSFVTALFIGVVLNGLATKRFF